MIVGEQQLWRAVISRALLDLIEDDGDVADHDWFNSYDFYDVCGLGGLEPNHILYIYSLITKNPNINKNMILLLLNKYQLMKEKDDFIQEQYQPKLPK